MATSSIHIANGAGGYFAHNSREQETVNSIFKDEPNFCSCSKDEAFKIYKAELETRTQAYLANHPTRKKLHAKTTTHLSAIVNFNKKHTPQDIKRVCDYLEKRFDTKVIQYSMHRDEGWEDNGVPVKNYHAHIEFMGLDSEGASVRQKLKRKELIELQTDVAKLLGMKRGTNYTAEQKPRPKRLDTYEFKAKAKAVHEAKQEYNFREMQKRITALESADTEQKKELHRLNSQVKNKKATIEDLAKKIKSLERKNQDVGQENIRLTNESQYIKSKNTQLQSTVNGLESKNKHLEEELHQKQLESDSRPNMSVLEREAEEYLHKELGIVNKQGKFTLVGAFKYLVDKVKELQAKVAELMAENKSLQAQLDTQETPQEPKSEKEQEMEKWWAEQPLFKEVGDNADEQIQELTNPSKPRRYRN